MMNHSSDELLVCEIPELAPLDELNRTLAANVHPTDWVNPRPSSRYNLVVVGAGTAGLVAAAGAAGLGAKVALIERKLMGGDCLNVGCVPSVAVLAVGIILVASSSPQAADAGDTPEGWHTSVAAARKTAEEENRPMIVFVTAKWCGHCRRMEKDTLSDDKVSLAVKGNYLARQVEFDIRREGVTPSAGITRAVTRIALRRRKL